MATPAQKRARQDFVNRFAYGLGRGVAHAKNELRRKPKSKSAALGKGDLGLKRSRAAIAFLVGLKKGISKRKAEQMVANARRA